MRKYKQIIMAIFIAAALVALSWFAGSNSDQNINVVKVLSVSQDVEAGTQVSELHLSFMDIPADSMSEMYFQDPQDALGQWTISTLKQDEIVTRHRLSPESAGVEYPDSAPGRRLMTIRLSAADANGYWLAKGNIIDLYLIPRGAKDVPAQKIPGLKIVRVINGASGSDQLLCLDLSREQADLLAESIENCSIRVSIVNE